MAMTPATARKTTGSVTHAGRPLVASKRAEVKEVVSASLNLNREDENETNEEGECDGSPPEHVPARLRAQEAQPNAEEAAQQHEVAEVREIDEVRPRPSDQGQLHEKHERAE